jgi:hypothetical protein
VSRRNHQTVTSSLAVECDHGKQLTNSAQEASSTDVTNKYGRKRWASLVLIDCGQQGTSIVKMVAGCTRPYNAPPPQVVVSELALTIGG